MKSINTKIVIATGGTGGHIFPALGLMENLEKDGFSVILTTDARGLKFIEKVDNSKIKIIQSSSLSKMKVFSLLKNTIAFIQSLIFLIIKKPKFIFGMGGYSSFPLCFAGIILRIPLVTYENNLHIGKSNRFLLPFTKKIFLAYSEVEGINSIYKKKTVKIGNILRKEILEFSPEENKHEDEKLKILVLGGSQAAKIFAEKLPEIFLKCKINGLKFKIFQQCLTSQNEELTKFYNNNNIDFELFNFSFNMVRFYKLSNLVISRAGSSALSESLNCNIPIITVPLKTAADNHQYKNANYFQTNGFGILLNEDQIDDKLFPLLHSMHMDKSILKKIIKKQKNYKDKFVFKTLRNEIKKIFYEN